MRIAYLSADSGVPVFGNKGCSIHVQEVVRALLRTGAQVELYAARLGGTRPRGLEGVSSSPLRPLRSRDPAEREREAISANDEIAAALNRRPAYDLVYERYSLWSTAGMSFARARGIPAILEVNAPLIEEQATHRQLIHRELAEDSLRSALRSATLVIAVSQGVAAYLSRFEEARGRVHVVPNGVDPVRFPPRRDPPRFRRDDEFTVGFVGSLKPWHDLPALVRAFDRLHRCHSASRLLIVGDGPERESLERQLEDRELQRRAFLTGAVPAGDVPRLMEAMDVAVAPYCAADHFYFSPLKVFEYMAAGLPIVASRVGQIAELIEHEKTGLLVEPGDPGSMAEALVRLRADPDLRTYLGRRARSAALQRHTWDAVVSEILDLAGFPFSTAGRVEAG